MYQRILLAYNGSAHSAAALRQAGELAQLAKAELHILGIVVATGGLSLAQSQGTMDVMGLERERITHALEAAANDLRSQGQATVFCVREGDPATEIVAYAYKIKADLAVLGHTDQGFIARWLQGSVGSKLLNDLPCSLLVATT